MEEGISAGLERCRVRDDFLMSQQRIQRRDCLPVHGLTSVSIGH